MRAQRLTLKQLDRRLSPWRSVRRVFAPKLGWVKLIRKSLGLTTVQLGKRLSVHRSRISMIEKAELEGAITLDTLKEVAEALNCDLIYAFFK